MSYKKIELPREIKDQALSDIKNYFSKEREEELGDLGAGLLLDFILENIGPVIYNQALKDSYSFMSEKLEDLFCLEKRSRP